jgi:hypothetical protein
MRHERLNFHPLENTATPHIARDDLSLPARDRATTAHCPVSGPALPD